MTYQLKKSSHFEAKKGPVVLLIMDGVGLGKPEPSNAVHVAKTPFMDQYQKSALYRTLKAHGPAVGMPTEADMGNSEVGHNAIGAGRIFEQGASLVKDAIQSKRLFQGETWQNMTQHVKDEQSTLHLIGLLSDGNVHAHIDHLLALIENAVAEGIFRIRLHLLTDGRDVDEKSALNYLNTLNSFIASLDPKADIRVASGGGRMLVTMDRYNADWPMVERGWQLHVLGEGPQVASAEEAIQNAYDQLNVNDQYVPGFVVAENGQPVGTIHDGDAVLFFNFRGDRAIELCQAFEQEQFDKFDRKRVPDVFFAGMTEYDGDQHIPNHFLVEPPQIEGTLGHYMCGTGLKTFAISETQKYGHVTYFWNGNMSGYIDESLETYIEIPSDPRPFEEQPAMRAYDITEKTIELLETGHYQFGRVNFPNGDMIGHTGVMKAAVESVEVTDKCVQKIAEAVDKMGGITIVCADHGNADEMYSEKDGVRTPKTAHTLNPVPFVILDHGRELHYKLAEVEEAGLSHIASTICNLLGFEAPTDYQPSLIKAC